MKKKLKILSWNINGFRAAMKKGFYEKIESLNPDIFCLQEIKAQDSIMQDIYQKYQQEHFNNEGKELFSIDYTKSNSKNFYYKKWSACSIKKGYSGVLIGVKKDLLIENQNQKKVSDKNQNLSLENIDHNFEKLGIKKFDDEGRVLIYKFEISEIDLKIALINCYYPQGGRGQDRIDYKLEFYREIYNKSKECQKQGYKIILTGDFNTTINDIDLARPKQNKKTTGCLPEERFAFSWLLGLSPELRLEYQEKGFFDKNFQASEDLYNSFLKEMKGKSLGLIDGFRFFYKDQPDRYSYWDQITKARDRNVGWRIDMFLIDPDLKPYLKDCQILDQVMGSDHCPVSLEMEF